MYRPIVWVARGHSQGWTCAYAVVDLLRHLGASRFARRGGVPPVYLSCTCNFERDDVTGELFTYEVLAPRVQFMASVKRYPHLRGFWSTALSTLLYEI